MGEFRMMDIPELITDKRDVSRCLRCLMWCRVLGGSDGVLCVLRQNARLIVEDGWMLSHVQVGCVLRALPPKV